jgi:ABC-type amino acid transport substrate-binding protein
MVSIDVDQINNLFSTGRIDIVMSGLVMTPERIRQWRFGASPLDMTFGFLVADHRRKEFAEMSGIAAMPSLTLGVVQSDPALQRQLEIAFPGVKMTVINSPRQFLRGNLPEIDAVVYSAEGGSAWTLLYPGFTVVVPQPVRAFVPAGYPVPKDDDEWAAYVDGWVTLRRKDGTIDMLFDHWIRGQGAEAIEPRWSMIRDVLGWVE